MVERKLFSSKENLEQLYVEQEKSTHEIGTILKTDSKTIWYWLKKYGIPIRSRSESLIGELNYWYGKPHSEEHKKRVSEKLKGRIVLKETKEKLSTASKKQWENPTTRKTILNSIKTEDYSTKMSKIITERAKNPNWIKKLSQGQKRVWKIPEIRNKRVEATRKALYIKPTMPEKKLIQIINANNFPFRYTGDGSFIINGFNPDFICTNNENKLIEVFGRAFHDPEQSFMKVSWQRQYFGRMSIYSQLGYKCLILWDDELKNEKIILEKIGGYINS